MAILSQGVCLHSTRIADFLLEKDPHETRDPWLVKYRYE